MTASIEGVRVVHDGWTRLIVAAIRQGDEAPFSREIEDHGNAVAVLPYDPARRVAMLVSLLRAPVLHSGLAGDLVEAPAGVMDEDDPAATARREALEEVGLSLDELEPLGTFWSMPGVSTERMSLFLAPYSARDRTGAGGGLAEENEGITVLEIGLDEIWAMIGAGALSDLKTVTLMLFLRQRHPELFAPEKVLDAVAR